MVVIDNTSNCSRRYLFHAGKQGQEAFLIDESSYEARRLLNIWGPRIHFGRQCRCWEETTLYPSRRPQPWQYILGSRREKSSLLTALTGRHVRLRQRYCCCSIGGILRSAASRTSGACFFLRITTLFAFPLSAAFVQQQQALVGCGLSVTRRRHRPISSSPRLANPRRAGRVPIDVPYVGVFGSFHHPILFLSLAFDKRKSPVNPGEVASVSAVVGLFHV